MFRRLPHSLPKDPVAPADLRQLGYFVNDDDQIRKIQNPDQKYQYLINKNERVNDVFKEAMNKCVRDIVTHRLFDLGFQTVRLPLGSSQTDKHVPILVSDQISSKKRVFVIFGERNQDPGIFSYRVTGDEGITAGSVLGFADTVIHGAKITSEEEVPGIVVTNPGQLLWCRGGERAVTWAEWLNLPRESAVDEAFRVDAVENTIPGNRDFREHVEYVFEHVLQGIMHKDVKLHLIGLEYPGAAMLEYLAQNWLLWSNYVDGICLGGPQHKIEELISRFEAPTSFVQYLSKKCRAYFISPSRIETPLAGREEFGCNCYSSGEEMYEENVVARSWGSMLDWFNLIRASPEYEEPEMAQKEHHDELPN